MPRLVYAFLTCNAAIVACLLLVSNEVFAATDEQTALLTSGNSTGREVYRKQCASCHGSEGQGVDGEYDDPLRGDASLQELVASIAKTMPADDPEACVGEAATAVAKYIYEKFYGPEAQTRLAPPTKRLARLTGPQLRQSLADIYARFGNTIHFSQEFGLRGRYSNRNQKEDGKKSFERIDSQVDFDFAMDGPGQEINATNFSIDWRGAIRIDVTGRYEFILKSTCAFVFYLGDEDREFINNHVQSESKTEFRKTMNLTGGRVYPLRIELNQRKRKTEQPPATISLRWRTPFGVEEVIPANHLLNVRSADTFSLQGKLPADDRSYGYERGIAVDRQWDDSTSHAAIEFADQVATQLWPKYKRRHQKDDGSDRDLVRQFLRECVETAFRGPTSEEQLQLYVNSQLESVEDINEAIRRVLVMTLKSPRFLYPTLDQDRSVSQRVANRLALTLFDSLPSDQWLVTAIEKGELESFAEVRETAERMINDFRVRTKTRELLYGWLNIHHFDDISKEPEKYPGFDDGIVAELRKSLDATLDEIVWSDQSDFRELFRSSNVFTSDRLARYFGTSWTPSNPDRAIASNPTKLPHTYGVLSHPYLMSGLAYRDSTSPIHRGVFLLRYVLGRTLRPPNEAFTPLSPDLHPDMTTRERISLQTSPANCQACHAKINGLGFILENFDATGRYQLRESGRAIDASGRYTDGSGQTWEFAGPDELAEFLCESEEVKRAFIRRAFQHFVKQPPAAFGMDTERRLLERFERNECSIRQLLVEIAVIGATHEVIEQVTADKPKTLVVE